MESEYFSHLDPSGLRLDTPNRPELTRGTVDFAVHAPAYRASEPPPRISMTASSPSNPISTSTSATPTATSFFGISSTQAAPSGREPKPTDYVFAFDLSLDGVQSGFVRSAVEAVLDVLYGPEACFPAHSGSRAAFVTYDSSVQFYDLQVYSVLKLVGILLTKPKGDAPRMMVVPDIDDMFIPAFDGLFANPLESR